MVERVELNDESLDINTTENQETTEGTGEDRPGWLPEKFQSPEALATAYSELERKQSGEPSSEAGEQTEVSPLSQEVLQQYSDAWQQQEFKFTDSQYGELEKLGLPRDIVDRYAEGQLAVVQAQANELYGAVGGKDTYTEMAKWAQSSLSEAEIMAYDKALETNVETARMAVQGLHAQYIKAVGKAPNLVQGNQSNVGTGSFQSLAEVRTAMGDPRYKTDSAYRKSVAQKISMSNI